MTDIPDDLPTGNRLVLFVTFQDMCLLGQAGPQTVFWTASRTMNEPTASIACSEGGGKSGIVLGKEGRVSWKPTSTAQ